MIGSLISEVSISRKYFVPQNLRIYDPIIIQVSQFAHMRDSSTQECHGRIRMVQMDKKGRRKIFHNSHIQWDISTFSKIIIFSFSSQDIRTFPCKSHRKSIAPRWLPENKHQNVPSIFRTYRCHEKTSIYCNP